MTLALETVRRELGRKYPLVIGGKEVWTDRSIRSINPARPAELIGEVAKGGKIEADAALASAEAVFPKWSKTPVEERARALERAAELMRKERFRLRRWRYLKLERTGRKAMRTLRKRSTSATSTRRRCAASPSFALRFQEKQASIITSRAGLESSLPRGISRSQFCAE